MTNLTQEEKIEILKSEEYNPFIVNRNKKMFIDLEKIPKDRYFPVNGDYVLGWKLVHILNESIKNGEMLFKI